MYYNKQGKEIDLMKWAKLFENNNYKVVKQENVGKFRVSTVWIGLDHGFNGGNPLIFETMVFSQKKFKANQDNDFDQERYSTLEEAKKGHKEMVKKYLNNNK